MPADLKPFFYYYGGKSRIAKTYPEPRYDDIVEPFAGSAGYSLRYPDRDVTLYDVDPIICGLWRYLITVNPDTIRGLPINVLNTDDIDVPTEAKWLIGFWINTGGSSPKKSPSSRYLAGKRPHSHWGEVTRERIASQLVHIRHWNVLNSSYDTVPDVEATWFVDPPYAGKAGSHYRKKFTGYKALANWCRSRRGQVMVCERAGAKWLPFAHHCNAKSMNMPNKSSVSKEVLWSNA